MSAMSEAATLFVALLIHAADPPTVDSLDFDAISITAPNREEVELILTALDGKAPDRQATERVWWILRSRTRADLADVVRAADAPEFRKRIDGAYQETLGRPATIVEVVDWAGTAPLIPDAKFIAARLRRMSTKSDRKLEGVVKDAEGKPVEGVVLQSFEGVPARAWSQGWFARSDAEGRFSFDPYSPQDFSMLVIAEKGDLYGRAYLSKDAPAAASTITLKPTRKAAAVVRTPDGKPLPNSEVVFQGYGGSPASGMYGIQASAVSDSQGRADVAGILEDDQASGLRARHRKFAPSPRVAFNADGPVELTVVQGAEFRGVVLGSDGAPLPGAFVRWLSDSDRRDAPVFVTDRKGAFSFVGTPGAGMLIAEHSDHAFGLVKASVPAGKTENFELRLEEGAWIEGRVEIDGVPGAHVQIGWPQVESLPGGDLTRALRTVLRPAIATASDAEGGFRIGPLPKGGKYRLVTVHPESRRYILATAFEAGEKGVVVSVKSD